MDGCPDPSFDTHIEGENTSPWVDPGGPNPQTGGSAAASTPPNGGQAPYAVQAPEPYSTTYPVPYPTQPSYGPMGSAQPMVLVPLIPVSQPPTPSDDEETVILVYKDGRSPLQIRNYILTRSAIYLTGKHFNEILLSDIDLQATQRVNWDAGVTFKLP